MQGGTQYVRILPCLAAPLMPSPALAPSLLLATTLRCCTRGVALTIWPFYLLHAQVSDNTNKAMMGSEENGSQKKKGGLFGLRK